MIRYFASHPTAANLLMLLFFVIGLSAIPQLRRETFPDFIPNEVEVRVVYPAATAEEVEEAICQRIENAVDSINFVQEVRAQAREGVGTVVLEMQEGGNLQTFLDDIKAAVEAIDDFPEATEAPRIEQLSRTAQVVSLALTGSMSALDLKAYSEQLKDRLQQLDGVSQVAITGFSDHQIRIEVAADTLMQYGLSISDIASVVARQSVDLPSGSLETSEQDILIRFADERRSAAEFAELVVVSGPSGAEISLGDIATITDRFELDEEKILFNGQRAAVLQITKTKSEDALRVLDAIKDFLAREESLKPPGVQLELTVNVASLVRDRLDLLTWNGLQGGLLVFLVMWLFFSLRLAFWVVMGLPVAFLGALFFMLQINYSINMMTMVGLLLAIGLLMDDAIVIAENIAAHHEKGKSALQAAIDGTLEVQQGVVASCATTVCVFVPLAFLSGDIGKVLRVMPVVLILVLLVSLVEAFWILPHHLSHALGRSKPQTWWFRQQFDRAFTWLRDQCFGHLVNVAVRWRYLFVGLTLAVLIASIGMLAGHRLQFQAFPDIDGDVVVARLLLPQGTPLSRTETVVQQLTEALDRVNAAFTPHQPNGKSLVRNVNIQYNVNADAAELGPHVATVAVDLLSAETRHARIDDILNRWRDEVGQLPDVVSLKFAQATIGPAGLPIDIRLQGHDFATLRAAAGDIEAWLRGFAGVMDLSSDLRPGKPEIRIRLREGATTLGLDATTIAKQLAAAFYGTKAREIQVGSAAYAVDVRLASTDQDSFADLDYFHVTLPEGQQVPLDTVAHLEFGRGLAHISRVDGMRTVSIQGDVDTQTTNTAAIMQKFNNTFLPQFYHRYPAVRVSLVGETQEASATGRSMVQGFLLGVVGIFFLLSFQLKSYSEPLVVMIAIPCALIGVIWGHLAMGLDLSLPSILGTVSLAGIVVNDSILLIEFIKLRQSEGLAVDAASRLASGERFRAVLLTSLTTIVGLLPLLVEKSLQAQILIPLAASIVFGLMTSTFLILLIVPALYAILADFGWSTKF